MRNTTMPADRTVDDADGTYPGRMGEVTLATRLRAVVHGQVQGVGFRFAVRRRLAQLDLFGGAENEADGTVTVRAEGKPDDVGRLAAWLRSGATPGEVARVDLRMDPVG